MLFKYSFHEQIANGAITVTYRAWKRARVKVGNRYRLNADGVVAVDDVHEAPVAQITDAAAHASGFPSRDALLRQLFPAGPGHHPDTVFEIRFHYLPDPRTPVADVSADVAADVLHDLLARLRNMDARSRAGPWIGATLALIDAHPRVAASRLAAQLGRETAPFKSNMRKLKALGLTISHDTGYTLTSLGSRVLRAL
ncbi:MAG: hypothetical protein OXH96_02255 [Spirochaetaceae bacterium]|nr:hypothetical protein [Spirochaetaceae bacterium]